MKKLSIITPVYNAGDYLFPMIQSVLSQTWTNLELILINDGSSDGSGERCDEYAKLDSRIQVIHQKNSGQAMARNVGLAAATGDYIGFVDDDDIVSPYLYETMINALVDNEADVCACNFQHATSNEIQKVKFEKKQIDVEIYSANDAVQGFFIPSWKIPVWNKIYTKEIINNLQFGNHHLGEDNLFSYNVICRLARLIFISVPMYIQRMHADNFELTGMRYYNELLEVKESILMDVKSRFPKEYPTLYKEFIYECFRTYNTMLSNSDPELWKEATNSFNILKKNIPLKMLYSFPPGHILLLVKIKYGILKSGKSIII